MTQPPTPARVDVSVAEHIATVTIVNPAKRNAMTVQMWRELPAALDRLAVDPSVRVAVLTGHGSSFCAGADLAAVSQIGVQDGGDVAVSAERALLSFPKPTVAAVRGYCIGGGCQLAAACDVRIAADDARFAIPAAKLGLVYPPSTTRRLVELIGPARTKHLLFSADFIDAERALGIGLVEEVVPVAEHGSRVAAFAATLAQRSQLTLRASKDIVDAIMAGNLSDARVRDWNEHATTGPDLAEGLAAAAQRRLPRFTWTSPSAP